MRSPGRRHAGARVDKSCFVNAADVYIATLDALVASASIIYSASEHMKFRRYTLPPENAFHSKERNRNSNKLPNGIY